MTVIRGHGLLQEGAPFPSREPCHQCTQITFWMRWAHTVGGEGHGRCGCGAQSPHLQSGAARKRWHKEHKASLHA